MQRAQRTFGRFLKRTPNEADVEAMLHDFNDSESMLEKVCELYIPQRQLRGWLHRHELAGLHQPNNFQSTRNTQAKLCPYACLAGNHVMVS
jgi:hypothetical protein